MERIQFDKSLRRLWAILLAFVCISFLTFPSNIENGSKSQANQNLMLDLFAQNTDFSQGTLRFLNKLQLSGRNNSGNNYMMMFWGLLCGFFSHIAPNLIFQIRQFSISKIKYFLIVSYSSHAPPYSFV